MSVYDRPKATATKLLAKFGQPVTITLKTAGAYDPATGTAAETTIIQTSVGAVFEWRNGRGQGFIDGTLIKAGDKQLLLSATGITAPNLGDTVTIGLDNYTLVLPLKPLSPAGIVVFYECNIRA